MDTSTVANGSPCSGFLSNVAAACLLEGRARWGPPGTSRPGGNLGELGCAAVCLAD